MNGRLPQTCKRLHIDKQKATGANRLLMLDMNVPFSSSGALSRRHYGLVRAAESSVSVQEANNVLRAEMEAVQVDMTRADLTLVNALFSTLLADSHIFAGPVHGMPRNPFVLLQCH